MPLQCIDRCGLESWLRAAITWPDVHLMKNTSPTHISILWLLVTSIAVVCTTAWAGEFEEGYHYHRISPALPLQADDGHVEVLELFWYGCPHCYVLEEYLTKWKQAKADHVKFVRMPAVMNRNWVSQARAYFALQEMGEAERVHSLFFEAIHVQGRRLRDMKSISRFLGQHGIDAVSFETAYRSSSVSEQVQRSRQLARDSGASAVPTIIVNGKYRTTAGDAGSYDLLLELLDHLALQEANSSRSVN